MLFFHDNSKNPLFIVVMEWVPFLFQIGIQIIHYGAGDYWKKKKHIMVLFVRQIYCMLFVPVIFSDWIK